MRASNQRSERSERSERLSSGADTLAGRGITTSEPTGAMLPSSLVSHKPHRFDFFQKRRSVAPLALTSEPMHNDSDGGDEDGDSCSQQQHTAPEPLVFLNQTAEFDFRSLFRRPSAVGDPTSPQHKDKRRLRAREELCLMAAKAHGRTKKAWFLGPGFIGRDSHEHTLVCTKDASMDAVHAEVLVDGDDYLVRDCSRSSGTYLCLSTTHRHHPQRDGFRLRNGDTFLLGQSTHIVVHDLCVAPRSGGAKATPYGRLQQQLEYRASDASTDDNDDSSDERGGSSVSTSRRVHFGNALNLADSSPIIGNRYKRKKKCTSPYAPLSPVSMTVSIAVDGRESVETQLQLPGKSVYLIGSSPACDLHVPATDVYGVHARIVFDGCFYVLQDLSFEENPRRKTRVALTQATRIGRGDCLLLGACVLYVVSVYRAFRDHEPDMKEVAFQCHLLRPSKRKPRAKGKYIPFGFRHHVQDPFVFGKGRHCEGHIFTASLNVEQFAIQLDHGVCSLVPRAAGINQGMYFLLGRDCMAHESAYRPDLVRYTSKALMLVEGSVFKCGNSELEVVYVKHESHNDAAQRASEVKENANLLAKMPWLQQIAHDHHGLENVAKRGQRLQLQPGDVIYDEGDRATFLFIVISGDVELTTPRTDVPNSWRLSAIEGFLSSLSCDPPAGTFAAPVLEHATDGSYFGEVCLRGPGLEYSESAKAASPCELLALSRDDVCGYFAHYMDIIEPHLVYECHKELLHNLRLNVAWLRDCSYQDLRVLAAKAELVSYELGESLVEDGIFQIHSAPRSGGLLLLGYGNALLVGSRTDPTSAGADHSALLQELWRASEPIMCSDAIPLDPMFQNVQARSRVECFFFDSTHVAHLMKCAHSAGSTDSNARVESTPSSASPQLRRVSTQRRSSFVAMQQLARHSQIVLPTQLGGGSDTEDASNESGEVEDVSDPAQKWRRKKRNKHLLEKTILETQQNSDFVHALVLYVLSGANRGDIHVVRNVATIGALLSDADIVLNDRYVSRDQAVIQHRDGRFWLYDSASEWGTFVRLEENQTIQAHPGDVFLAGEVEFTCLAAFPVRKKTQICCIQ